MPKLTEFPQNSGYHPDWTAYYKAVTDRPPRETLLQALAHFDADRELFAVDLGCGDGRDTVELLRRGWRVLAIDGEAEAIARLKNRPDIDSQLLETQVVSFAHLSLPQSVDLINASFCLPFCHPAEFPTLWSKIVAALKVGGHFSGQLFGERDSWALYPNMTHLRRDLVEELLAPFVLEYWEEEDHPGKTALGEDKHWHIFQIVARKRG